MTASAWSGATARARPRCSRCWPARASPRPGRSRRSGEIGYLPQDPRTGDLDVLAARPGAVRPRPGRCCVRRAARGRGADGRPEPRPGRRRDPPVRRGWRSAMSVPGRLRRRGRGRLDRLQPRPARPGAAPAAGHAVRRPAAPGGAGPDPVRRLRRRCCWTSRPTTWTPTRSSGCATTCETYSGGLMVISHDVDAARGRASTRSSTSTPTAPRSTSTTWAGRPTSSSARPTSGAASASGPTPRGRPPR